jgi:hypothetical protein
VLGSVDLGSDGRGGGGFGWGTGLGIAAVVALLGATGWAASRRRIAARRGITP